MKIECPCGHRIHDGTDALPHKAHLIPDQAWHELFDRLDDLIEHRCHTPAQRDAACTIIRAQIGGAARQAWQRDACGRLHVDDHTGQLQVYLPAEASTSREVLRGISPARDGTTGRNA